MNPEIFDRFVQAIRANMCGYGLELSAETIEQLGNYFVLLTRWNERLHLVAPCGAEEFATRHVLESLLLLRFLPSASDLVDVGSGAGLPIIPCLVAGLDLKATLIESSQKKSVFLREALNHLGVSARAEIVAKPFEKTKAPHAKFVTCRALDEFITKVPALVNWAPHPSTLLLFGGETLRRKLDTIALHYTEFLIPFSEKRFLFEVKTSL